MPRVDIVIPVYNGASFIAECLASVVRQTHLNWRATVVNNCSADGTGAIADAFALKDNRIRVLHCTDFVDQCGNYNRALAQVSPEADYVKVLEADNWLMPDALARMIELAEAHPRTGIIGSYWLRGARVDGWGLDPTRQVLTGREAFRLLYQDRVYLFGTPTTLLFRAKSIREQNIWFRPGMFYDDLELCARILKSWELGFIHQVLSYVRDDNNGLFNEVRRLDYEPAFRYFLCRDYGSEWFNAEEFKNMNRRCERQYFRQLGFALLTLRGSDYWNFHRALFSTNGALLRKRNLIVPILHAVAKQILSPFFFLARAILPRNNSGHGSK